MLLKTVLPRCALGLGWGSGCGPSVKRISSWNCIQSARICSGLLKALLSVSLFSMRVTSLGSGFFGPLQSGSSSVAVGNSSLVMPISTL